MSSDKAARERRRPPDAVGKAGKAGNAGDTALAELLQELKERSGRSYTALAHRCGMSRSSLHRYCRGSIVPSTFEPVERLARVCGASRAELDVLYRTWSRASAGAAVPGPPYGGGSGGGSGDGTGPPHPAPAPAAPPPGGRARPAPAPLAGAWRRLRPLALLLVLAVTSTASGLPYGGPHGPYDDAPPRATGVPAHPGVRDGSADRQGYEGPDWSVAPRPVPSEFFGLTLNTDTGQMPGFPTGAVRLWESETRWGALEPRRGHYRWQVLERMVDAAEREGLPVLLTLSGTPLWAAPGGRRSAYGDSLASPPADLADWDRFVRHVVTRYRGRVESYELWDYAGHPLSFSGSVDTLARMTERAAAVIEDTDPDALVVCPSFGELWTDQGRQRLRDFARTGAYEHCDAVALKTPPRTADGRPEEMLDLVASTHRLLYEEGCPDLPVWNTGTDRDVAVVPPLDERRARDYAVRFYLVGIYGWHDRLRRTYFYSWGSTDVPLVVEPVDGAPTEAGRRMGRLREWLDGARVAACGRGVRARLTGDAYTCRFERRGESLRVYWTSRGDGSASLAPGAYRLRHMDGRTERVRAGDRLRFGEEPVLVDHREG
ncbi:helix-turn-helix domain-containing protein [Streptomyces phytohabitans]|uniref:helix-turn-helix domain-containing protein n=1 Tax=Streptomyces phytohabitans TaxID=1150371 RepID=UPI00345C366C